MNLTKKTTSVNEYILAFFGTLSISVIRSFYLSSYRDLMFDDETSNIYNAIFVDWYKISPEGGLLYTIWYKFLYNFIHNPVQLFYFSWTILHWINCFGFYCILRKFRISPLLSFLAAAIAAHLSLLEIGPFASLFASAVVVTSFSIAGLFKDRIIRLFVLASMVLVSSYIRPELMSASIFCLLLAFFYTFKQRKWMSLSKGFGVYLTVWVFCYFTLGSSTQPFQKVDSLAAGRGTVAFGTLYAFGYAERHNLTTIDPWKEWERIVAENFPGDPKNMTEIFFANPLEFLNHMAHNLSQMYKFARLYVPEFPIGKTWQSLSGAALIIICISIFSTFLFGIYKKRKLKQYFVYDNDNFFEFVLISSCIFLNNLIAVLIIYPRYHYLVVSGTLIFIIVAKMVCEYISEKFNPISVQTYSVLIISVIFLLSPSRASMTPWWMNLLQTPTKKLEGLSMVETILENRSYLENVPKLKILEADFSRLVYLKKDFYPFTGVSGDCLSIQNCIQKNTFDLIAMDSRLKLQYQSYDPSGYDELQSHPETFGYKKFSTGYEGSALLIRADLVQ